VDDVEGEVMDLDPAEVQQHPGEVPRRTAWIRRRRLPRVERGRPAAAVPEGGPGASSGGPAAARSQRRGGAAGTS
jgi:hypothetical protein